MKCMFHGKIQRINWKILSMALLSPISFNKNLILFLFWTPMENGGGDIENIFDHFSAKLGNSKHFYFFLEKKTKKHWFPQEQGGGGPNTCHAHHLIIAHSEQQNAGAALPIQA